MMDQRILGRLEQFAKETEKRLGSIEQKVDALNDFKLRVVGGSAALFVLFSMISHWFFK